MNGLKLLAIGALALGTPAPGSQVQPRNDGERTLYYFFGPDSPGQAELARRATDYVLEKKGAVRLRSVLLVGDFAALGRIKEESPFTKSLKELGRVSGGPLDLAIYDEEGLALARSWKIERLPAIVLVTGGRAHVAIGSRAMPQDLEECR
jgi:hypothetical protein